MDATQYNKMGEGYKNLVQTPLRTFVHDATFNALVPELIRQRQIPLNGALDLACGEGRYTRQLKQMGFVKVVGTDISEKMIQLAREQELASPLGIDYSIGDAGTGIKWGEFDLATAWFLLHYGKSKEHLEDMCATVAGNLKDRGVFVAYQSNPFASQTRDCIEYGEVRKVIGREREGADIEVTLINEDKKTQFIRKLWKPKTYEAALRKAGFKSVKWIDPIISTQGIEERGEEFWRKYKEEPSHKVIVCVK